LPVREDTMTLQACGEAKYEVYIGEEKGRFNPYKLRELVTKAEFEAGFAEAGDGGCDFAWTSETTAEWYSRELMPQEDGSEAKEWIHKVAKLVEPNTVLDDVVKVIADVAEQFPYRAPYPDGTSVLVVAANGTSLEIFL
jgi:urease gamma subunit